jgi:hypothetical protein
METKFQYHSITSTLAIGIMNAGFSFPSIKDKFSLGDQASC